jgi:hypothetical protein
MSQLCARKLGHKSVTFLWLGRKVCHVVWLVNRVESRQPVGRVSERDQAAWRAYLNFWGRSAEFEEAA